MVYLQLFGDSFILPIPTMPTLALDALLRSDQDDCIRFEKVHGPVIDKVILGGKVRYPLPNLRCDGESGGTVPESKVGYNLIGIQEEGRKPVRHIAVEQWSLSKSRVSHP